MEQCKKCNDSLENRDTFDDIPIKKEDDLRSGDKARRIPRLKFNETRNFYLFLLRVKILDIEETKRNKRRRNPNSIDLVRRKKSRI